MSVETDNEFVFTWKIENYLYSPQRAGEAIESPPFTVETISDCKWVLLMYPKGYFEDMNFVRYALRRRQPYENLKINDIEYIIEVLKADGTIFNSSQMTKKVALKDVTHHLGCVTDRSVKISDLENEMKSWENDILTLRCRIFCDKQKHEALRCEAATEIGVAIGTFREDVNALLFIEQVFKVITFCIPGISQFKVTLTTYDEHLSVNVICTDKPASLPRSVKFELTFLEDNGRFIDSKKEWHLFDTGDSLSWNFPNFIKKKQLHGKFGALFYIFTIIGKVTVSNGETISRETKYTYIFPKILSKMGSHLRDNTFDNCKSMQSDFRKLFTSKKHCDVTLLVGKNEFRAHKLVLTARSPVFSVMFDQEMSESKTGIVEIHDVDSEILKIFLEYIYTDSVDKMDYEIAKSLLLVADKYEVVSLKERCAAFLMSVLEADNACEVTIVSDMVNHESLKKSAIDIIKENASGILSSPKWLEFIKNKPELTTEVFIALSKDFGSSKNAN